MPFSAKIAITPKPTGQQSYEKLDLVVSGGRAYLSKVDINTYPVTNSTYWLKMTESPYDTAVANGFAGTEAEWGDLFTAVQQAVIDAETAQAAAEVAEASAQASANAFSSLHPEITYKSRVDADGGLIKYLSKTNAEYRRILDELQNDGLFYWSGVAGYKESGGKLPKIYNMARKVQTFTQKITNGDMSSSTGWILNTGFSISGGKLLITAGVPYNSASQPSIVTSGKLYKYSFTIDSISGGSIKLQQGTNTDINAIETSTAGTYSGYFIASVTGVIQFKITLGTVTAQIDNLSVEEINIVDGVNDASETTNPPYIGGNIAPNENIVIKNVDMTVNKYLGQASKIEIANIQKATLTFAVNVNSITGDYAAILSNLLSYNWVALNSAGVLSLRNSAGTLYSLNNFFKNTDYGNYIIFSLVFGGNGTTSTVAVYKNGAYFGQFTSVDANFIFNRWMTEGASASRQLNGSLAVASIYPRQMSVQDIKIFHEQKLAEIKDATSVVLAGRVRIDTSNAEVGVDGAGHVIPEVQNANNIVKLNDTLTSAITGFDQLGTTVASWDATDGGVMRVVQTGLGAAVTNCARRTGTGHPSYSIGKRHRVTFRAKSITGSTSLNVWYDLFGVQSTFTLTTDWVVYERYYLSTQTSWGNAFLHTSNTSEYLFDDLKIEEVGWTQLQAVYDTVYNLTTGTAAYKDLVATRAASAWCHFNNDVATGAIYGKSYNWWCAHLFDLNSFAGKKVIPLTMWYMLQYKLGGSSVAGGKLKALSGGFNNAFATNESGLSIILHGQRMEDGSFTQTSSNIWTPNETTATTAGALYVQPSTTIHGISTGYLKLRGKSIRYMADKPEGELRETITSGYVANALGGGTLDIEVPWGYRIEAIRVNSRTGITGLSATYAHANWNVTPPASPTLTNKDTLLSGQTITANEPLTMTVTTSQRTSDVNAFVRIGGTKADTAEYFKVDIDIVKI